MLLSKTVYFLVTPLGFCVVCFAVFGIGQCLLPRRAAGWRTGLKAIAVFSLAWLLLWSTPWASASLRGWLEAQAGPRDGMLREPLTHAVVLGGGVEGARLPQRVHPNLDRAADRMWHAARLYHAGQVKALVLAGGVVPTGDQSESSAMQAVLRDFGVPDAAMLLDVESQNTQSNALAVKALLEPTGVRTIALVTSALHMRRAKAQFEKAGFQVTPAPTDFEVVPIAWTPFYVLPDAVALADSGRAFKEVVGYWLGR